MKAFSKKVWFVMTLLCFIVAGIIYRNHKNNQKAELKKTLIYDFMVKPSGNYTIKSYKDSTTQLWLDRSYHTNKNINEIAGYEFIAFSRNAKKQLIINCKNDCEVYTLANTSEYINLSDWEYVREIYVHDVSAPRIFNGLYKKRMKKGLYILNNHLMRPSLTLFFSPNCIEIIN